MLINSMIDFCHTSDRRGPVRKKWTEVEDDLLIKGVCKHGHQWGKVSDEVPNKDGRQCQARWKILKTREDVAERMDEIQRSDDFDRENQDFKIRRMKKQHKEAQRRYKPNFEYEDSSEDSFVNVQQYQELLNKQVMNKQIQQQIREQQQQAQRQYQNVWNKVDDKMLMAAYKIYQGKWNQIYPRFSEKNPQSCLDRYNFLMNQKRQKLQDDISSLQLSESENKQGSEIFDISESDNEDSTEQSIQKGVYTVQQCYTNIERILKTFTNHNLDTLPGIRESIVKLIITD